MLGEDGPDGDLAGFCLGCWLEVGTTTPEAETLLAEVSSEDPGSQFGHYVLARGANGQPVELGRGSMGVTYRALDTTLDCDVALKVIQPLTGDAARTAAHSARTRFLREARAAARLRHPNVAAIHFYGERLEDGRCFYAMELVEGETLEARVRREGPLPAGVVVEVATQVTRALQVASEQGLIHRDLKPSNLMLVAGKEVLVKVIDFGLAKAVVATAAAGWDPSRLTQPGFIGTPAYASPEQFAGGETDIRSDLFSLGATLWFLLTGRLPFPGRSLAEIHDRQTCDPLPTATLARARTPRRVVRLVRSLLAADPEDRPQTPREVLALLDRCRGRTAAEPWERRRRWQAFSTVGVLASLLVMGVTAHRVTRGHWLPFPPPPLTTAPGKSVAVLPFENLSDDKDNTFFADGIQDDVLTALAKIGELRVAARTSVMGYRGASGPERLREIGRTLSVENILEGSVRRAGAQVRVSVRLLDPRDSHQLWAEIYDRPLADSLLLQGEVAAEIARTLRAKLSPEEKARVERQPTENPDAYLAYLRARDYQTRPNALLQDYQTAEELLRRAIGLDPRFALAHARLAETLAKTYHFFGLEGEQQAKAQDAALEALRLQPDLGEGHLALALYLYWISGDFEGALRELDRAGHLTPGDPYVGLYIASIRRRQGRWTEALAGFQEVLARDPRNAEFAQELASTLYAARDWPAAARAFDRTIALAPDLLSPKVWRAYVDWWERGDPAPLQRLLAALPPRNDPSGTATWARWDVGMATRDFAAAERALAECPLETLRVLYHPPLPRSFLQGCVALAEGQTDRARAFFESARPVMEVELRAGPDNGYYCAYIGLLYAHLGRKEDALREGRRGAELLSPTKDAYGGSFSTAMLALIYARTGETDQAVSLIQGLLTAPGAVINFGHSITLTDLRRRWEWDPLRGDPRFQALLVGPGPKALPR